MHRTARARRAERGATLVEVGTVAVLIGIAVSAAIPYYGRAVETTRVDQAAAILRTIERSQRMYWLEHREYADELSDLHAIGLLDRGVTTTRSPFAYRVTSADAWTFTAEAERDESSPWFGTLTVDQAGDVTGTISNGGGQSVQVVE